MKTSKSTIITDKLAILVLKVGKLTFQQLKAYKYIIYISWSKQKILTMSDLDLCGKCFLKQSMNSERLF